MANTSINMSMTAPAHTKDLTSTSTTIFATTTIIPSTTTITTSVMTTTTAIIITHTAKEKAITTAWISQIVVGSIFTCVVFLLLMILTVTVCFSIHKTDTTKNGSPVVPIPDSAIKDVNNL